MDRHTLLSIVVFFFNDPATTEIYTLSLHDALPICPRCTRTSTRTPTCGPTRRPWTDRKSTRLNSSHVSISYAVFCLKKKNPPYPPRPSYKPPPPHPYSTPTTSSN